LEKKSKEMRGENRPMSLTADKISALQKKYGVVPEEAKDDNDETRSVALSVLSENKVGNRFKSDKERERERQRER
jgi:hypothetical protein